MEWGTNPNNNRGRGEKHIAATAIVLTSSVGVAQRCGAAEIDRLLSYAVISLPKNATSVRQGFGFARSF